MAYSALKKLHPTQLIGASLLIAVLYVLTFWVPPTFLEKAFPSLLAFYLTDAAIALPLGFALTLLNGYLLLYTMNKHEIFKPQSFLPFALFGLMLAIYPANLFVSSLLVANACFIWVVYKILYLQGAQASNSHVLEAAFFTGIASLFFWPSIFIFPVIILSAAINGMLSVRSIIISVIGFILPWFVAWSVCYLLDWPFSIPSKWKSPDISLFFESKIALLNLIFAFVSILLGLYYFFKSLEKLTVEQRNQKRIAGFAFLVWIIAAWSVFVTPIDASLFFVLLSPVLAFLATHVLYFTQRKWMVILYLLFFVFVCIHNFGTLLVS